MSDLPTVALPMAPLRPASPLLGQPEHHLEAAALSEKQDSTHIVADSDLDEATLAGPPPAFDVSLMELDRALRDGLARQNAERAFAPADTETPGAQPDAQAATPPEALGNAEAAHVSAPLVPGESA